MKKYRALMMIDYNINGNLPEFSKKYEDLRQSFELFVNSDSEIVHHSWDMKERRGNAKPDVKEMKFRKT